MQQFLLDITLWIAFFFVGIICTSIVSLNNNTVEKYLYFNQSAYGDTYRRMQDFEQSQHIDLITLGSSTCYRGINPSTFDSFGIHAFNLCSGMQTISGSNATLEWSLKTKPKPKYLILDVYPEFWDNSPNEYFLDLATNHQGSRNLNFFSLIE